MVTTQHRETPTPSVGYIKIYGKSDDKMYYMTSSGVEVEVGAAVNSGVLPHGNVGNLQFKASASALGGVDELNWDNTGKILRVTGSIGSPSYEDYVSKIYSNQIRLDNLGDQESNNKLLDVIQSNPLSTQSVGDISNNGLGKVLKLIQTNIDNTQDTLNVENAGSGSAIQATTSGGEYAGVFSGGTSASILALNGIDSSTYNSIGDQVQQRSGVTKLTHGETQTTITQDLGVQGSIGGGNADLGASHIGTWSNDGNYSRVGHKNFNTASDYGMLQHETTGDVIIKAPSITLIGATETNVAFDLRVAGSGTFGGDVTANSLTLPKETQMGVKVDTTTPTFPWHDLIGDVKVRGVGSADPSWAVYRDSIRQYQFDQGSEFWLEFHIPHDYLEGSDMFIHVHWSHNDATTPTGTITWEFESTYAKGHQQQAFGATKTISTAPTSALAQYTHMITEVQLSESGGSATMLDTDEIEVDGLVLMRLDLSDNSFSGGTDPFVHTVDIHYQSTGIGTKQKAPNFYV